MKQAMEPLTDLAVRFKSDSVPADIVPRTRRQPPTDVDWQRWKPVITARYKSATARVLVGEMEAEGLRVSERMFRYRLHRWSLNDKNRRSAVRSRALQSAGNEDNTSKSGPHSDMNGRNSSRSTLRDCGNIHNLVQTPEEELVLHRTLKGVRDWQQHAKDSLIELDYHWTFPDLLKDMKQCLHMKDSNPFTCDNITLHLRNTSAKIYAYMQTCTPLAVLYSVDLLSYFTFKRNSSQWYEITSRFLINAAVEALPASHPSLLLLRLLFGTHTPWQLAMIYKEGSDIMGQCYGEAIAFRFRIGMHSTASRIGQGAAIRSYADELCAATPDITNPRRLYDIASLYFVMSHYKETSGALQRCLAKCEDEGDGDSSISTDALRLLAFVQSEQNDFEGEETTLWKILKIKLARDRRELSTPQLSVDALDTLSDLDAFYEYHDLNKQRYDLHLKYPSAFEH